MICTCTYCGYTFESTAIPDQCPDCGKFAVRIATEEEKNDHVRIRAEFAAGLDNWYENIVEAANR